MMFGVLFPKKYVQWRSDFRGDHTKLIAVFSENWTEMICVIDEKLDVIKLVASMKLGQKPSCRLFHCSWIEAQMEDFVCIRINRAVQPELLTVETDHLFVNREQILRDSRDRL
ncbi:hypothetical protein SAMN05216564_12014 [Halopenitus persicus]|uniref:Uncharacterized protein n=1 Tax=Halopenitus persicus TaxID=1048396 RepID=A0A1H3P8P3_9EURY|nr:hypothetical protein SAMN05216564_12014 [Halopenitus persicus]